jgi:PII-like signaling protein
MQIPKDAVLLRVFCRERDKAEGKPLYEVVVRKAREAHMAGATVLRGQIGFGRSSQLHSSKMMSLSDDLSLIIEIVDSDDKIEAFLPTLGSIVNSGLVTTEMVQVLRYGPGADKP